MDPEKLFDWRKRSTRLGRFVSLGREPLNLFLPSSSDFIGREFVELFGCQRHDGRLPENILSGIPNCVKLASEQTDDGILPEKLYDYYD